MNFLIKLFNISFLTLVLASASRAANVDITFVDPYVRGLPPTVKNTAAYMTIRNEMDEDLTLTGVTADVAETVMIHRTVNDDGMMSMQQMKSLSIPANGEVKLESGDVHLMLMGLKQAVAPGQTVNLTLEFDNGGEYLLSLPVRSVLDE